MRCATVVFIRLFGQQAQEGTHVWRCRQTSTALAGILHGHDGSQRSLSGWLQGDKERDEGIIVRPPVPAC
jgi:hypothetical protein